ncbi:MAG TPA: Ada metal-binding domain-containing protein [Saliniramus sp.]|nr:Ada metal-binding domain-containing protein [Saliniramus sp.]
MSYTLIDRTGKATHSATPGALGGNARSKLYGRFDCPSALAAIARADTYARTRVFFADEETAVAAGYRPCARCLPLAYRAWKARQTAS